MILLNKINYFSNKQAHLTQYKASNRMSTLRWASQRTIDDTSHWIS